MTSSAGQPAGGGTSKGGWFRINGRQLWHAEANREYGVVWSCCGLRAVLLDAEQCAELPAEANPCQRCAAARR